MLGFLVLSALSVGGIGILFGIILGIAAQKLKVEIDGRIIQLEEILSGANCGACGYAGCAGYARALIEQKDIAVNLCIPGGAEVSEQISKLLQVGNIPQSEKMIAKVRCSGDNKTVAVIADYKGIMTCRAAALNGGNKACTYGCLGYGDCTVACPFDAIHMQENGLPEVDDDKCTGCGLCVTACPRKIIELVPASAYFFIRCVSRDPGPAVKKVCARGCIACTICVKVNDNQGIRMEDNLPVVDYKNFKGDNTGADKCPVKVIQFTGKKNN